MNNSSDKASINTLSTDKLSTDISFSSNSSTSDNKNKKNKDLQNFISKEINELLPNKKYLNSYNY